MKKVDNNNIISEHIKLSAFICLFTFIFIIFLVIIITVKPEISNKITIFLDNIKNNIDIFIDKIFLIIYNKTKFTAKEFIIFTAILFILIKFNRKK